MALDEERTLRIKDLIQSVADKLIERFEERQFQIRVSLNNTMSDLFEVGTNTPAGLGAFNGIVFTFTSYSRSCSSA